jgi:tetratricopeptide (TPR) repeat protein
VLKELAHIQAENGQTERANETYVRILDLSPEDDEARRRLAGVRRGSGAGRALGPVDSADVVIGSRGARSQPQHGSDLYEPPRPVRRAEPAPVPDAPPASAAEDLDDEVARILTEADVYIKYGLHDRAVEHLRQVFGKDPNNVVVRLRLRDLYVQLDRYADAALELVAVARYVGPTDPHGALEYLDEAVRLDPKNRQARDLRTELHGAAGAAEAQLPQETISPESEQAPEQLPIEDFEEVMPIDLDADDIVEELPVEASDLIEVQSFDEDVSEDTHTATVEQSSDIDYGIHDAVGDTIEVVGETTDTLGQGTPSSEVIPIPVEAQQPVELDPRAQQEEQSAGIEDDLDEAEFFVQQGLYDEAQSILDDLLARSPGNPLVEAKLAELQAAQSPAAGDALGDAELGGRDLAADLALELDDELADEMADEATTEGVQEVFAEFKRGVEDQVSDEDSDTHYDLGIAYREMGLLDDAIVEFKTAMRSSEKEVLCHMMIGICQVEKGLIGEAINQFKTGLYVEGITERETIALYFELGQAYENLEDYPEALYYHEKVAKRDPKFRDVVERVRRLKQDYEPDGLSGGGGLSVGSSDPP